MSDRVFLWSFAVSLGLHLTLLARPLLVWKARSPSAPQTPFEVIYEQEALRQQLEQLQEQLARATREATAPGARRELMGAGQIRVPERPSLTSEETPLPIGLRGGAVVDLTNVVEASRGDPVLLSYFSAIREQIQRTANRGTWLAGESVQGLVYVTFMLGSSGAVGGAGIVPERSVASERLREIALRIVTTAAAFPPFPPSLPESSQTVVVPLEFLLDSPSS